MELINSKLLRCDVVAQLLSCGIFKGGDGCTDSYLLPSMGTMGYQGIGLMVTRRLCRQGDGRRDGDYPAPVYIYTFSFHSMIR